MLNESLMSSDRPDWNTPANVIELVRAVGPIGLDPCSNPTSIVGASCSLQLERGDDGLTTPWTLYALRELIYVNPPYGREIGPWIEKCRSEAEYGAEIIALVPARTDARWFQHLWTAQAICFWRGRLKFLGAPSSAPFPSALPYWGKRPERFAEVFSRVGHVVRP